MKILISNPPWFQRNRRGVRAGSRWPHTYDVQDPKAMHYLPFPFYMAYGLALLRTHSTIEAKAIDAIGEGMEDEEYLNAVESFAPDLIFAESSTPSIKTDLEWISKTKQRLGNVTYILTGPHVSSCGQEILQNTPELDYAIIGEYEWVMEEFILKWQAAAANKQAFDPQVIDGLIYRDESNGVVQNKRRALGDFAGLPFPAWDSFPMYRYRDYFCQIPAPMVNLNASRGCPHQCDFCLWPDVMYGGQNYRKRQPISIVDEMEYLVDHYGFKSIYFDDDTFNLGKKRLYEVCDEIIKRNLHKRMVWAIMARADGMDEALLRRMRESGLIAAKYGIESADQRVLDRIGKRLDINEAIYITKLSKALGVRVHLTFSLGLSGDSVESMEKTMALALDLDPYSLQISYSTPFPGTRYYREAKAKGYIEVDDERLYDGTNYALVRTDFASTKQITELSNRFHKKWNERLQARRQESLSVA